MKAVILAGGLGTRISEGPRVKKELQLIASHHTLLQVLSASVFEKTQISCPLQPDADTSKMSPDAN